MTNLMGGPGCTKDEVETQMAPSPAVNDFSEKAQQNIADAMKRIQGAIVCLERVLASDLDINDTIRVYDRARELHSALNDTRKRLEEKVSKMSEETIPKLFLAKGQKTVTLIGLGRVTVGHRVSASLPDKEKGYAWLRKNKHGDMITETVNAQTLGAWINADYIKKNKEPPDIFKVSISPYTSITKAA